MYTQSSVERRRGEKRIYKVTLTELPGVMEEKEAVAVWPFEAVTKKVRGVLREMLLGTNCHPQLCCDMVW